MPIFPDLPRCRNRLSASILRLRGEDAKTQFPPFFRPPCVPIICGPSLSTHSSSIGRFIAGAVLLFPIDAIFTDGAHHPSRSGRNDSSPRTAADRAGKPAGLQQKEAEKYDPYPLPDVGPDMAARPLAFIRPASETERAQDATTFEERYGQPPPPGIYRPPRSSSGPQIQYVPVMPLQNAPAFVPPATLPPPSGP